tara:strand:- start:6033 stop:8030 length:1998 start_codon:yes stop_codon:yes gene_type:complete
MPSPSRRQLANAIRALSMDAVQKANSGHPGCPMGMADIAEVVWNDYLQHNPANPNWQNRDRFVLSNGHGSMLLYSLLHLSGYDLALEDLQNFRQLHSKTPGHPELGVTPGVETTTGPLGQGLGHAVGMALGEQLLANQFNQKDFNIIDNYTYAFCGDGCLMEGVSHEVCSLAGTLGLGKLIVLYDDNGISIDGPIDTWFSDDTAKRFEAYGWQVIEAVDGHDASQLKQAMDMARSDLNKPTLIICKTEIGFGSPHKAGKASSHGAPLGEEEITLTKEKLEWQYPAFMIPEEYRQHWDAREKGARLEENWNTLFNAYQAKYPVLAKELIRRWAGELPQNFAEKISQMIHKAQNEQNKLATRKSSYNVLSQIGTLLPEFVGGSADLTGSNLTAWSDVDIIKPGHLQGNYLHYGVREFGMFTMMNGLSLYGGFLPYGGTFLTFVDYGRNAVRLSALMKQRCIYVLSHDSIGLGEDGPTHQPIEHISTLRAMPGTYNWRPCDEVETIISWEQAIQFQGPSVLILSRQGMPAQSRNESQLAQIRKGAYVLYESKNTAKVILMATGSEVSLCIEAAKKLEENGVGVRVVSMPCMEAFEAQDQAYQDQVLPPEIIKRVAVEAGSSMSWYKYTGLQGKVIGLDSFGESAPAEKLFELFGFTAEKIQKTVETLI